MILDDTSLPAGSPDNTPPQARGDLDVLYQTLPLGEQCNHNGLDRAGSEAHRQPAACSDVPGCDVLPTIQVNKRPLRTVLDDTMDAIRRGNDPETIFSFGNSLARVLTPSGGPPAVDPLSSGAVLELMSRRANYMLIHEDRSVHTFPPSTVARVLLARASYPRLPVLDGITPIPVLRP